MALNNIPAGNIHAAATPRTAGTTPTKATGAQILLTLADMEGSETFDPALPRLLRRGVRGARLGR